MSWSYRRLASSGLAVLVVPLLLLFAPNGSVSAEQVSPSGGSSRQVMSPDSNGVVPSVTWWGYDSAVAAVQAAGFVAQIQPGWVDCGPPFVQFQQPAGGTSAPLGSSVSLFINQQPGPGGFCP